MFIAMNRFKIILGKENEFEQVWRTRETYLEEVDGFKEFHLLKLKKSIQNVSMRFKLNL